MFETSDFRVETTGEMTVWDAFKIGVKGTNSMFLGSGIDIMLKALDRAKDDGMVTVPPFIEALDIKVNVDDNPNHSGGGDEETDVCKVNLFQVLKNLIKTAKTVHDQKLDRWGPRTPNHSTNPVPYDKRLGKKKKFVNPKASEVWI